MSFQLVSSSQSEGIEDRTALTALSARRLAEMVQLGEYVAAMELVVAAQAIDLREPATLGRGTDAAYRLVRGVIPPLLAGEAVPIEIDAVISLVRSGAFQGL